MATFASSDPKAQRSDCVNQVSVRTLSTCTMLSLLIVALLLVVFANGDDPRSLRSGRSTAAPLFTENELRAKVLQLMGDDVRLFRFNALKHTKQLRDNGACDDLTQISSMLLDKSVEGESKALILEYLTFCITDSPPYREQFSLLAPKGVHSVVIELVMSEQPRVSSMASHLIYIASFSNNINHQEFIKNGAVENLAAVVLDKGSISSQKMWAAAAMQNLAASYCETEDDGRCYWGWGNGPNVQIDESNLPMKSDGSLARAKMLKIPGLVAALEDLACLGPVGPPDLKPSRQDIFPGANAILGRDDTEPHVVTWAAIGALKNLALEPSAKPQLESVLQCICHDRQSPDWLEKAKSNDLLSFMRRGPNPCWIRKQNSATGLCIDMQFRDAEGYACRGYGRASEEECKAGVDPDTQIAAVQACCGCGGGNLFSTKDNP